MLPEGTRLSAGQPTLMRRLTRTTRITYELIELRQRELRRNRIVGRLTGVRYAGEFPRELFRKHGIACDLAKQTKSELFRDLLPLLNSGRIVLPRNDRLQGQIVGLERRTSAVGRDTISHPDRGHDDVANAVAGAAALSKFREH
jgi:hypothetical protein